MGKILVVAILIACSVISARAQNFFDSNFQVTWGTSNVQPSANGQAVSVSLNKASGANFKTTKSYLYGGFGAQMQLPGGDSAGVCTAYFLTSDGSNHDELDYEFLGNVSGQPYIVQTNVFANGIGGREERIYVWFDAAAAFHTYSFVWNQQQVTFLIDDIPIRIYGNYPDLGVDYPSQAMEVYSSIFDASSWATRGGADPVDYSHSPFVANYQDFGLDGCTVTAAGSSLATCAADSSDWWSQPSYKALSSNQIDQLRWVRKNYLKYSYCTDTSRYPTAPAECARNNP